MLQRSDCVRSIYKGEKRIVNNFVNIYEHLRKKNIVHRTYFAHKPTP